MYGRGRTPKRSISKQMQFKQDQTQKVRVFFLPVVLCRSLPNSSAHSTSCL